MTITTKRQSVRDIHQFFIKQLCIMFVCGNKNGKRNDVVRFYRQVHALGKIVAASAVLAFKIVSFQYCLAPLGILFRFTKRISEWSDSTFPVPVCFTSRRAFSRNGSAMGLRFVFVRHAEELRNSAVKMTVCYPNRYSASTLTKVFSFMFGNKCLFAILLRMIARIFPDQNVASRESSVVAPLAWVKHACQYWYFNGDGQEKSGELLETLSVCAEGNQQPSRQYTAGRFRDYWSGKVRLITRVAPGPIALGMI